MITKIATAIIRIVDCEIHSSFELEGVTAGVTMEISIV